MENYIGIDISKNTFDVHFTADQRDACFDNTDIQIEAFAELMTQIKPTLIVMEATGGYERPLAAKLHENKLPVAVENPRRIRNFAKAVGQLAKTDTLDARINARYAAVIKPAAQTAADVTALKIKELNTRRQQLLDIRTAEKCRTEHAEDESVVRSINTVIAALEHEIEKIEKRISTLVSQNDKFKQKATIIRSVPGIGAKTVGMLIGALPELGFLNRRQIAALVGLAPINRDSGRLRGKRMTGGGRVNVRKQLYMPTLVAIQHNPVIRKYYNHLLKQGKVKMVAVVACMRKLLTILNSMVKKNESWKPKIA